MQDFSSEALVEKYFSSRPMKKEDYDYVNSLIKAVKEKPEGSPLTPLEQEISERLDSLPLISPEILPE